jgi:hypothetical protein
MKQVTLTAKLLFASLLTLVFFLAACKKENSVEIPTGSQNLSVFLTDNPALFDKVLIDIRQLEVCVDTSDHSSAGSDDDKDDDNRGSGGSNDDDDDDDKDDDDKNDDHSCNWQNMSIRTGVYDLLTLRNGVDTLLGTAQIAAGRIRKIRITLGANNTLVIDSVSYPLTLGGNGQQSIEIKVSDDDLQMNGNRQGRINIDFDAGRSIISRDNRFFLYPQLKSFCDEKSARIEGRVTPLAAAPVLVTVYNATDSSLAIPDAKDGEFKIRGLNEGTYSVSFKGSNGFRDTVINNISLSRGKEFKLPVIQLRK